MIKFCLIAIMLLTLGCGMPTQADKEAPKHESSFLDGKAYPEWMRDTIKVWAKSEHVLITDVPDSLSVPDNGLAKDHGFIGTWVGKDMWEITNSVIVLQKKIDSKATGWQMYTGGINPRWIYLIYKL
jgi:hypothetical protein